MCWTCLWEALIETNIVVNHLVFCVCVINNIFRFKVYFSSKLNIIDACVVVITLVVTMIYTFTDLSGPSLIPRYLFILVFMARILQYR